MNPNKIRYNQFKNETDKIKFVSMIDQRPIKPSYLELIPLKHFVKKDSEAQRNQFKESQK